MRRDQELYAEFQAKLWNIIRSTAPESGSGVTMDDVDVWTEQLLDLGAAWAQARYEITEPLAPPPPPVSRAEEILLFIAEAAILSADNQQLRDRFREWRNKQP